MSKSVSSYAPEMLALLLRASISEVRLSFTTKAECTRLRHRLHSLRNAMRRENHPNTKIVEGVQLRIEQTTDPYVPMYFLIIEPVDSEWLKQIRNLNIDDLIAEPKAPSGVDEGPDKPSQTPDAVDVLDNYLKQGE